jgi:hypothetical protein
MVFKKTNNNLFFKISLIILSLFLFNNEAFAGLKTKAFFIGGGFAVKAALKSPRLRTAIVKKTVGNPKLKTKAKDILTSFIKNPKNSKYKEQAKDFYKRVIGVPHKVGGRNVLNKKYAGKSFKFGKHNKKPSTMSDKKWKELNNKYPDGIQFNQSGFPNFTPYAKKKVRIKLTGNSPKDFKLANKKAGYKKTPENYTWHHNQDKGLMELIPTNLHQAVRHTGGVAKQ